MPTFAVVRHRRDDSGEGSVIAVYASRGAAETAARALNRAEPTVDGKAATFDVEEHPAAGQRGEG